MLSPLLAFLAATCRIWRNERLTRSELLIVKLKNFRDLVRYAQKNSSFYAEIIRSHSIDVNNCVPEDFPVINKRIVMENFDAIVTDQNITKKGVEDFLVNSQNPEDRFLNKFAVVHTSGSSGEVGYYVFSKSDWMRGLASHFRAYKPQFRENRIAFFGATEGHFAGVSWATTARKGFLKPFFKIEVLEINSPLDKTIGILNSFQPHLLSGYATGNKILAAAQLDGRLNIRPDLIECSGEPLSRNDQDWLEKVFGCPCISMYASTETMTIGVCGSGEIGMTIFDDNLIIEPTSDHIIMTNLFNRTMPLIRYQMSDVLRITDLPSSYGPYLVSESIIGRNEIVPQFINSAGLPDFISPHTINEIVVPPEIRQFQFRCINDSSFCFAVCFERGLVEEQIEQSIATIKKRLNEILIQKGLTNVEFYIEIVQEIAVDPITRKFRLIVPQPDLSD